MKGILGKVLLFLFVLLVSVVISFVMLVGITKDADKINTWKITQYSSVTGNQAEFYSIERGDGELVLVDGGFEEDAEQVMDVIRAHDNHVYAWIITHPHPDHVGAFNAVMSQYQDQIQVDKIYTTKVNKERYEETAQDYDVIDAYYKFLDVSKDFANITYLEENDEFEMIGLHVEVLHAWDEFVDRQPLHSCNFGSLMFKLEGKKQSILYCSDNGDDGKGCGPMEQDILSDQKDNLDADYVQLGHHGNWGFTEDFYDYVTPDVAFMDAPASITQAPEGAGVPGKPFDAADMRKHLESEGCKVYDYTTCPNVVVLK